MKNESEKKNLFFTEFHLIDLLIIIHKYLFLLLLLFHETFGFPMQSAKIENLRRKKVKAIDMMIRTRKLID